MQITATRSTGWHVGFLKARGEQGENNMGLRTMQLVDFMVKQRKWTMVGCKTGHFGVCGDKREQQLVFRNDEHVQHGTDHIMVELRTGGCVEVNGLRDALDLKPQLDNFVKNTWRCTDHTKYARETEDLCYHKYTAPRDFFDAGVTEESLTTKLGTRTLELSEFMAAHGWALLLANGSSVQPGDRILREQQLKYTRARTREKFDCTPVARTIPDRASKLQKPCMYVGRVYRSEW